MSIGPDTLPSFVLGTAGHIDHGKSTLVRYLTGVDPDRLSEEKRRGITIELGFAELVLPDGRHLGVVDVPGHERFVRHMVEGATGVDVALLVVAADDGVMVQTREHIAILELLGVSHMVVAVSKADAATSELVELACLDVAELLAKTPFAEAEVVAVSGITGMGVDALLKALCRACDAVAKRPRTDTARLPIDRVFTIDGAGTVVTGTLWEGSIAHDNVLELWPSGARARVRSIQVHGASCAKAVAGQRVALNLGGVKHGDVSRGDVLATPDALHGVARFNAHLRYLGLPRERAECLECGRQVHVHHGTREVIGRIKLLHENCTPAPLEPGETAFVQLYLDDPLPLRFGDRFIIRSFSPLFTIGGGQVLETDASPRKRVDAGELDVLDGLRRKDFEAVLPDLATIRGVPVTANALANKVGITEADAAKILDRSLLAHVKTAQETIYLSAEALKQTCSRIEEELLAFHKANPRALDISVRALMRLVWQQADSPQAQAWTDSRFEAVLATMAQAGTLCVEAGKVRHAQAASSAQALHDQVAETLLTRLDEQGLMVEGISALASALEQPIPLIAQVLGELVRSGQLVRLASDFHFTKRHIQAAEKQLRDGLGANAPGKDGLTAAEVRDLWQVSRKYAIPLLEYFDAQGITKREGELRFLA